MQIFYNTRAFPSVPNHQGSYYHAWTIWSECSFGKQFVHVVIFMLLSCVLSYVTTYADIFIFEYICSFYLWSVGLCTCWICYGKLPYWLFNVWSVVCRYNLIILNTWMYLLEWVEQENKECPCKQNNNRTYPYLFYLCGL